METWLYAVFGAICLVVALCTMLYRWMEHNEENDLNRKTNPLKGKWILMTLLGAITSGMLTCIIGYFVPLDYAGKELTYIIVGVAGVFLSIFMTLVYNEGLSTVIHLANQRVKKAKEAVESKDAKELMTSLKTVSDLAVSQASQIEDLKNQLAAFKAGTAFQCTGKDSDSDSDGLA